MAESSYEKNRRWMLLALMVGVFLSPVNVNFTSVALPTMRDFFGVDVEQVAWVGTAYFIPTVVMMPLLAHLGGRWGARRVYVSGLVILSFGAFLSAVAPTFTTLLISRVIQGIGWSALYPLPLILIREHYPEREQGTVMGTWEAAVGAATIVGPVVGGALVAAFGWHMVYVALAILALAGALLSLTSIPPDSAANLGVQKPLDWPGALGLTLILLLLMLGVTRRMPVLLLASALGFLGWRWLARRTDEAFIDPAIFSNWQFMSASMAAMLRMLIAVAALIAMPLYLEDVRAFSPALVGIIMSVYSVFLLVMSWQGGRWSDRSGGRAPGMAGFLFTTVGVGLLILIDMRTSLLFIGTALAIRGLGAGLAQAPFAQAATGALPPDRKSQAAGIYGALRYTGSPFGSALVGILLQARFIRYASTGADANAIPAFQELFIVLTILSLVGIVFAWLMGSGRVAVIKPSSPQERHA